ncbi:MAG: hypothetical protein ACI9D5_002887 [Candidatus Endobugula sp.]|jgi:hypothetical protein
MPNPVPRIILIDPHMPDNVTFLSASVKLVPGDRAIG